MACKKESSAFTLVELLVVIGIIALLAGIMIPVVSTLTKGNSQKQAVNTISAYISAARTRAIAEGRQVGVVFFEDLQNANQTAIQICVERNTKLTSGGVEFTSFDAADTRIEYLPRGIRVATLNDGASVGWANNTSPSNKTRVIIFDAQGQLVLRNGLCVEEYAAGTYRAGTILRATGDSPKDIYLSLQDNNASALTNTAYWRIVPWHFDADYTDELRQSYGTSAPGIFVFDYNEFNNSGASNDTDRATWLQQNADILVINANTGAVIR